MNYELPKEGGGRGSVTSGTGLLMSSNFFRPPDSRKYTGTSQRLDRTIKIIRANFSQNIWWLQYGIGPGGQILCCNQHIFRLKLEKYNQN